VGPLKKNGRAGTAVIGTRYWEGNASGTSDCARNGQTSYEGSKEALAEGTGILWKKGKKKQYVMG